MNTYWRLGVTDEHGSCYHICGCEETMRTAYDELRAAMEAVDGTGHRFVEVHGICDSMDRAATTFFFRIDGLQAISLTAMYA